MNTDIVFGQYCEGKSLLHRLDPRAKIIISILFIVDIFIAKSVWAFALTCPKSQRRQARCESWASISARTYTPLNTPPRRLSINIR